jgi:phospholipase C
VATLGATAATGAPVPRPTARELADAVQGAGAAVTPQAPVKHVVIVYQENHTFDNVLGQLCVQDHRCDGADRATLSDGSTYTLKRAADVVPNVSHGTKTQVQAIDRGKMDGFDRIAGCAAAQGLPCLTQYDPSQIPNLAKLARTYALSDRTFQMDRVLSWGAHLELVTTDLDGFAGEIPKQVGYAPKTVSKFWGCNSNKVTGWRPTPSSNEQQVPACIPNPDGTGTFWDTYGPAGHAQTSPVASVPTVLDELNDADKSWRMYLTGEGFDICSYVAKCHDSAQQRTNVVPTKQILDDAAKGSLPAVSIVLPSGPGGNTSQHNHNSMALGDNWIGDLVSGLQKGPDWDSTAVFVTYDDCGCFYDHVAPPGPWGMRMPMVIVSPYAKAGYTDSTPTSFVGMITFIEHLFGLPALTAADRDSYDYAGSFDFSQAPAPAAFHPSVATISPAEARQLAQDPWREQDDPT